MNIVEGVWTEVIVHPHFWVVVMQASGWYFLAGMSASVLTLYLTSRKVPTKL